jgi:hypothetical protein
MPHSIAWSSILILSSRLRLGLPRLCRLFRNIIFYGEELLALRPTPKLEDYPLSAVRDCLFNVFAATLHNWRPFLYLQPEDAPCRGDSDPLNTESPVDIVYIHKCQSEYKYTRTARRNVSAIFTIYEIRFCLI